MAIGDTMGADSAYYSPEGALRMPPEMRAYLEKINLERDLAQKKAEIEALRAASDDMVLMIAELIGGKNE